MQKFRVLSSKKQRKSDRSVRVLFPNELYEQMRSAFAASEAISREGYAIAQCGCKADATRKNWCYMVRSLSIPVKGDLLEQSSITVTPRAEFIEAVLSEAGEKGNAIMEIHTHVGSRAPSFSWADIENGLENGRFLKSCDLRFSMMVMGSDAFSICEYDADNDSLRIPKSARVSAVSRSGIRDLAIHKTNSPGELPARGSPEGMHVSIIGLNGIGLAILYMLAGMGVKKFTLLDDGIVDESWSGVVPYVAEKGKKRARAAYNMLKKMGTGAEVSRVSDHGNAMGVLKDCDAMFVCDGNERMGAIANEASMKYFIPCIEARTLARKGTDDVYGRVRLFMPSATGCMTCFSGVAGESLSAADASDMVVDNVVASLAIREFSDLASDHSADGKAFDHIEYDPSTGITTQKSGGRDEACPICGKGGVLGAGEDRKHAVARKASRR